MKEVKTTLYRVTTTHIGAGSPTETYFDNESAARRYFEGLENGEIECVEIVSDAELHYKDVGGHGCSWFQLTYGWEIDAEIISAKMI